MAVRIVEGVWNDVDLCRELKYRVSRSSKCHLTGAEKKKRENQRDRRETKVGCNNNNNTQV